MLVVSSKIRIPIRELKFTFARSGGPGGQNVNKLNTKAVLHWSVVSSPSLPETVRVRFLTRYRRRINSEGELVMTSQRFRDQGRNVADCLEKLRELLLDVATEPKKRKKTKPSKAAIARRLEQKKRRSQRKQSRRFSGEE